MRSSTKKQGPALGVLDNVVGQPFDLRPVEYSLLMLLSANAQLTPKQHAQSLALSAPNLTILLDRMQDRGMLQRVRSEVNRRSQHVMLIELLDKVARHRPA